MPSIFEKVKLRPSQLRTVATRRLADAQYLRDSGRNERANGAMYLAGFVVECLMKAELLEEHPWLQNGSTPVRRPKFDQKLWSLCYRSHDLMEILARLPQLIERLKKLEQREQSRLIGNLRSICGQWTIFARYSPRSATMREAGEFLAQVKELRQWLN
jgi:hypothetical protein